MQLNRQEVIGDLLHSQHPVEIYNASRDEAEVGTQV